MPGLPALALSIGQGAPRHKYWKPAGKAFRHFAAVAGRPTRVYGTWRAALIPRQHVILAPAGGGIQKLQRQSGHGLAHADDSVYGGTADCLRLTLPTCCWRAASARRFGDAHGAWSVAPQSHPADTYGECFTQFDEGVAGLVVAYTGSHAMLALALPQLAQYSRPCQPLLAGIGICLPRLAFYRRPLWNGARVVVFAYTASRFSSRLESLHERPRVFAAASFGHPAIALSVVLLAGAFAVFQIASQSGAPRTLA